MPLYTQADYSPSNPPPDSADPLALTAYNPLTWMQGGAAFGSSISAGTTRVGYNDTRLTYRGATEFSVTGTAPDTVLYSPASVYPHNRGVQLMWGVEFYTDAAWLEFQIKATTATGGLAQAFRLYVDGRRVTDQAVLTAPVGLAAGVAFNARLDFPSTAPKRVLIEFHNAYFNGIFVPTGAAVWKVPAYRNRTLVIGDSVTGGGPSATGWGISTWFHRVALLRGWDDPWNQALQTGGYIANTLPAIGTRATGVVAGSTGGLNDIAQYDMPSGTTRVIIFAGFNDVGTAAATVGAAAATMYQNLKAAMPAALIYVIGCWNGDGAPTAAQIGIDNELQTRAAAAGIPFISPITGNVYNARGGLITSLGQWVTAEYALKFMPDNVHPNDAGYNYISRRIAAAIGAIEDSASTSPPWAGGLHAAIDDGDPTNDKEWNYLNGPSTLATLTPTALTATAARTWTYNCQYPIVVNRVRWYGIGATAAIHRLAVYRASDGVQVIGPLSITTTADAWNSVAVTAVALAANTTYYVAFSATTTGTTAGVRTGGTPLLYPPLQASTPGGLAQASGDHRFWFGQFAVTAGVLPATLPTLVRGTAWTAGLPLFFFDSNSAA